MKSNIYIATKEIVDIIQGFTAIEQKEFDDDFKFLIDKYKKTKLLDSRPAMLMLNQRIGKRFFRAEVYVEKLTDEINFQIKTFAEVTQEEWKQNIESDNEKVNTGELSCLPVKQKRYLM